MTEIFRILENSNKTRMQKILTPGSSEYPSGEWQALNLIESSAKVMAERISSALPRGYTYKISKVDLQLFEKPGQGEKLFVKAQVYPAGKNTSLLKVFAHELNHRGKSVKLARATYYIQAIRSEGDRT